MFKNKTVEEKKAFRDKVMIGTAGVVVGVGLGIIMVKRDKIGIFKTMVGVVNIDHSTNTVNNIMVAKKGELGHVIMNNNTGQQYGSIAEACKDLEITRYLLKKHLKGDIPDINGDTFTNLGEYPTM